MIERTQIRLLDRVRRFTGVAGFVLVLAGAGVRDSFTKLAAK